MAGRVKLECMASMNYPAGQQEKYRPTAASRLQVPRAAGPSPPGFKSGPASRLQVSRAAKSVLSNTAPTPQLAPYCLIRLVLRIGQVGVFDSAGAPGRRTTRGNSLDVCGPPRVPPTTFFQHSSDAHRSADFRLATYCFPGFSHGSAKSVLSQKIQRRRLLLVKAAYRSAFNTTLSATSAHQGCISLCSSRLHIALRSTQRSAQPLLTKAAYLSSAYQAYHNTIGQVDAIKYSAGAPGRRTIRKISGCIRPSTCFPYQLLPTLLSSNQTTLTTPPADGTSMVGAN